MEIASLNITTLRLRLTSYSGRAELYVSQTNPNPNFRQQYDQMSSSMDSLVLMSLDLTTVPDLWNWQLYIGVYAAETTLYSL